jgi:hypothetical protein
MMGRREGDGVARDEARDGSQGFFPGSAGVAAPSVQGKT